MTKPSIIKSIFRLKNSIETFINTNIENNNVQGLITSHGNILVQLYKEDKQPMSKIAAHIGRCKSTLTVLVGKLEKIGFITRETNSEDTRVKKLCLTEKAKEFQPVFWQISHDLNTIIWQDFTEEEQKTFLEYLERMQNNLQNNLPQNTKGCTNNNKKTSIKSQNE